MSEYPEARRVVLTVADTRRLTLLERARACATVGIAERELAPLLMAISRHEGSPEELERGTLMLYAIAWQLERRISPATSWEDAQAWDLALDLDAERDPIAEAEARASVEAALATGLPPAAASDLTLAQAEAYQSIRQEAAQAAQAVASGTRLRPAHRRRR